MVQIEVHVAHSAAVLEQELAWLSALVDASIRLYLGQECQVRDIREIAPPALTEHPAKYAQSLRDHQMTFDERAILALALVPHVRPQLLDPFLAKNPNIEPGFTEFGGILAGNHG